MKSLYKQAKKKSESIPCEFIKRIELEDDLGTLVAWIDVMRGNKYTRKCIGIHTTEDGLDDAIQTAAKDNLERIYVYGGVR